MLTVATILNETPETTVNFVSWYLDQGVERIVLAFDDPHDASIEMLGDHPQLTCICCDDGFWAGLGVDRSVRFPKRQNLAMTHVYHGVEAGWMLNLDSDELMRFADCDLQQAVAQFDDSTDCVTVLPAEEISTDQMDGQTHFRLPMEREQADRVYGGHSRMMKPRAGLTGHCVGKSFIRAGQQGLRLRQHWPVFKRERLPGQVIGPDAGAYLPHLVNSSYDEWRKKVDWRLGSSGFHRFVKRKIAKITQQDDPEPGYRALYGMLNHFDDEKLLRLQSVGRHLSLEPDLATLSEKHFPGWR